MSLPQQLGRYVLERKLAAGGMAEVFLARQSGPEGFEKVCVVKRMLPHLTREEAFISMFLDEARLAARLSHPNIAQIFDFGHAGDSYFLAMEYVPGANLHRVVDDHTMRHQKLPVAVVARIVALAAAGLDFAHHAVDGAGKSLEIIHRDISPHNIMLSQNGDVKLIDFGIAKAAVGEHSTKVGTLKGKYAYMSPEQIRGQPIDKRTDIYAMGLVLYELLAGHPAVQGENESALMACAARRAFPDIDTLRSDVPAPVRAVLSKALAMAPADRYATAAAMADDLEDHLTASGTRVRATELAALLTPASEVTAITSMPSGTPTREPEPSKATPAAQTLSEVSSSTVSDVEPNNRAVTSPEVPKVDTGDDSESTSPQIEALRETRRFPIALALGAIVLAGAAVGVAWSLTQQPAEPVVVAPAPTQLKPVTRPPVVALAPAPAAEKQPEPTPPDALPTVDAQQAPRPKHGAPARVVKTPTPAPAPQGGKGTVAFRVLPYAEIFQGDKSLGVTPMKPVELDAGRYTFKLVCADTKKTETRDVNVSPGAAVVLKVDLR